MPITKNKKKEIFDKLSDGLEKAKTLVFANFHGLTVGNTTEVRKGLREKGVSYMVAKKTITRKVLENKGYKGEVPELTGELAIVWGEDQIAPAKAISEFEKKFDKKISILGGVFEGGYIDREAMNKIALIPPREVLLSQIAYLLMSPMQRLAIGVSEVAKKKA